jgi:Flp pilus assembly protein TadB
MDRGASRKRQEWPNERKQAAFAASGVIGVVLLFIFSGVTAAIAAAAAWIALLRHFAQTDADRQRRITENFSKAIEQLGSDKLEVCLGGIYALERISQESPRDYWAVMENLTAFVRERSRRNEAARRASSSGYPGVPISCGMKPASQRDGLMPFGLTPSSRKNSGNRPPISPSC